MTRQELLDLHGTTCNKAFSVFEAKNHDYTAGSEDPFANFKASEVLGVPAEIGILVRCVDKFQRIRSFAVKGELKVKGESVDDAIEDVINYMVLLKGVIKDRTDAVSKCMGEAIDEIIEEGLAGQTVTYPEVQDGSERLMTYEEWCNEPFAGHVAKTGLSETSTCDCQMPRPVLDLPYTEKTCPDCGEGVIRVYNQMPKVGVSVHGPTCKNWVMPEVSKGDTITITKKVAAHTYYEVGESGVVINSDLSCTSKGPCCDFGEDTWWLEVAGGDEFEIVEEIKIGGSEKVNEVVQEMGRPPYVWVQPEVRVGDKIRVTKVTPGFLLYNKGDCARITKPAIDAQTGGPQADFGTHTWYIEVTMGHRFEIAEEGR